MPAVLKNIKAAYSNLRTYIPETIKTFRQDTGRELSLKNYLEVHAIEPERLLSDRTWTQWKAAAGIVPAPADQDLAVLGPAVARACQITAPGYLGAIKALPASGLSLVGEDAAAANMLYSMLWGERGEQRGLAACGYSIYLFVRLNRNNGPLTAPFQFLGRGACTSFEGERPISMVWLLEHPMPAELLEANRVGG